MSVIPDHRIRKRIFLQGGGSVVLVEKELDSLDPARNIYLIDDGNEVLWQIDSATLSHGVTGFSDVYLGQSNELLGYSANGIEYQIDITTGTILGRELIK